MIPGRMPWARFMPDRLKNFLKKILFSRKNSPSESSNDVEGVTRVEAVAGGEQAPREWLAQLVREHEKELLRLCCVVLRDVTQAEDAVQETFIKAYRNRDAFRSESSARTWLVRIAINTCRDMQRGAWNRLRERSVDLERLQIPVEQEMTTSIALTMAIMKLPVAYREAVYLYYYQDMTIGEVAEAVGSSSSSVSRQLSKAIKLLRRELDAAAEGGEGDA